MRPLVLRRHLSDGLDWLAGGGGRPLKAMVTSCISPHNSLSGTARSPVIDALAGRAAYRMVESVLYQLRSVREGW